MVILKRITRYILAIMTISAAMAVHVNAQVQVQAQVDRSKAIYAGSQFTYSIVVANGGQPDDVDLAPLKKYNPSNPSTQSQTSIVNGRVSGYQVLSYQLTAIGKGDFTIPSINVKVDGKTYQTNPVQISVVEPGTTKQIDVETQLSTVSCYAGQPVIFTMSFYVWTDVVRSDQIANINIQVPVLDDESFYIEDVDLQPANTKQTIMQVNGRKEYVYQDQVYHDGVDCVRVQFVKVLIPQKTGSVILQPASISADLAVRRKNTGRDSFFRDAFGPQYEYQRFGVQSKSLQLSVQQLPQAGKPNDFYGLVGNYTITAEAEPKQVNVGDPITLTISVGGSQYLKPVQWPELEKMSAMTESFKIPSDRSDGNIQDNVKVFTQTIRPNNENVKQIPPIPLSFFDAAAGRYRTVLTKPIPLQVSPTRVVTGGDVESRQFTPAKKHLKAIQEGLSANYTTSDALINQRFSPLAAIVGPAFIIMYAIPFIALVVSIIIRYALADSPQRRAANKRKKAYLLAVKNIRNAKNHEKPSQQVLIILKQYAADKFGKSAGALTAQDCGSLILENTNDADLSHLYQDIMEQTEASEYSPTAFKLTGETQKEILELLAKIEKQLK